MGRFSPRGHNLAPYMQGGPAALSSGFMSGLNTVTGIKDRGKRTNIMEDEAESREKYRDAQMSELEFRLQEAKRGAQSEWGYRDEAPVIAEGPSTQQPQQVPGAQSGIPKTQQMPVYAEGESSVDPGMGRSPGPSVDNQMGQAPGPNPDPGMDNNIPMIQGTDIPGDRYPRIQVEGGSRLEQPRSYHRGNEALQQSHTELHGEPLPGTSSALAQGLKPYEYPRESSAMSFDEWKRRSDYNRDNKGPSAGEQARDFGQQENRAEAYAASLVSSGMDEMQALQEAEAVYGVYPDVATVHRALDQIRNQLEGVYRYIGVPQNDWQAHAIRSIVIGGQSIDSAVADYRNAADPNSEFGIEDPVTGEQRKMTPEEFQAITEYIDKYGSVDNRSGIDWSAVSVNFDGTPK